MLGRGYTGIDLSIRQIEENRKQAQNMNLMKMPCWEVGSSLEILRGEEEPEFDLVFSCPPYFDLEVYGDDPRDLSTMSWDAFVKAYKQIIHDACSRLLSDRFACFVVGDVRDPNGFYRGLPSVTYSAFEAAGLRLWNDAVLVTAVGSLPIRAGRPFEVSRKIGKTHQNVLVFVKGDARKATAACGNVDIAWPQGVPSNEG